MPITNCMAVLRLPPAEAKKATPVRLKGVLTCYIPNSQLCFVQDQSGGVYVYPSRWASEFKSGDIVEVEGETGTGRFSAIVNQAVLKRTGQRGSVEPKRISIEELNTGRYDCQWVELQGVVQASAPGGVDALGLEVWTGGSAASALVFEPNGLDTNLVDAEVILRGVGGTIYDNGRLASFGLFVLGATNAHVVQKGDNPFTAPIRPAAQPFFFSPDAAMDHRIRVQGTVAAHWPEAVFIQDESGVIRLQGDNFPAFSTGDEVEAAGFLRDISRQPYLANAVVRRIGRKDLSVSALSVNALLSTNAPVLTVIEGTLARASVSSNSARLVVEVGGRLVSAFCPVTNIAVTSGSHVRVTGVWSPPPREWHAQSGPGLWMNSADSLIVITRAKPPIEPAAQSSTAVASIAVCSTAAIGLGIFALRKAKQAREASERSQSARELLAEAQVELQRLNSARERLGRDLHDHIIQSVYAIGLNLDDCAQQIRSAPERVEPRLKTALGEINSVIRELRNVILGLETNAIEPREFRTALKSLSLVMGQEKSNQMRLDIEQDAMEGLTPLQATELMHIAREALSNSLRHGHARTTTFALHNQSSQIQFSIEDDGLGFDPKAGDGRGFGLRNMAKRAENIGAKFTIHAQPGSGTRIVLDIPRQKQHFSPK